MRKVIAGLVIVAMLFSSCVASNYTHGNTVTVDISEYDTSASWYVSAEYVSVLIEIDSAEGGTEWKTADVEDGSIVLDGLSSGYWIIQVKAETESATITGYGIVLVDGDVAAELEFTVEEADGGEDDGGETGTGGDEDGGSGGSSEDDGTGSGGSSEDDGSGSGEDEETAASTVYVATLNDYSGMKVVTAGDNSWTFTVTLTTSSPAWYVNNVSVDSTLDSGLTATASDDGASLTVTVDSSSYSSNYLNVTCLETDSEGTVTRYYADLILS